MGIKLLLKKIIRKVISYSFFSSEEYLNEFRKMGISIGKGTFVFDTQNVVIDATRPWMLKIGAYVKIAHGVIILAHDYSRSVLRRSHGEILAEGKNTVIGDNVFLGMNSIILAGTRIGNNVIVGAGTVVSGTIPDNVVVAGNPCQIIRTLDEHYLKRKNKTIEEAKNNFLCYKTTFGKNPDINPHMGHFFPCFYIAKKIL